MLLGYQHFVVLLMLIKVSKSLLNSCDIEVKLTQTLLYDGLHRNLTFDIIFGSESDNAWLHTNCRVCIDQELPAGVFSNPDELEELWRHDKTYAKSRTKVNVELPTELSTPVTVYVIGSIDNGQASLWLPVHGRYHQPTAGGGLARNTIGPPKIYLNCPDNRLNICGRNLTKLSYLCNGSSESCSWKLIPYKIMSETVVWNIPVGNTDHYNIVTFLTLVVLVLGSLYLFKSVHENNKIRKKLKFM